MINICTHIVYQLYNMEYVNNVNCYVYNGAYTCMQGRAYPKLCGHPLIVFICHLYKQLAVYLYMIVLHVHEFVNEIVRYTVCYIAMI